MKRNTLFRTWLVSMSFFIFLAASAQRGGTVEKQKLDRAGNPTFMKFDTQLKGVSAANSKQVLKQVLNLSSNDEFKSLKSNVDRVGFTHEKFQQYYQGIKVENGVYILHSQNNIIESLSGEYKVINNINVTPKLTSDLAIERAKAFVNAEEYMWELDADYAPTSELVIVANDYNKHPKDTFEMVLAYKIDIYATKPLSRQFVYINAHTGEVVHVNARIHNSAATGSAVTRYSGTKNISTDSYNGAYRLRDVTRGGGIITYNCNESTSYNSAVDFTDNDNNWLASEYDNSDKDNGALDAHWAGMVTYDYWQDIHGRNSFDNNGAQIKTYVHYDSGYENAYWNGSVFTFGDGASTFDILTSLDVFGHEFGHAVCENTCNLTYSKEPGALNEAFSDIWGCTIEHYYAPDKETWNMGEDLGYILRSLSNPKSRNLPDTYKGDYWVSSSSDYYGVHTNNGPFCYWYYLISEGGTGTNDNNDAYSVTAIGIEKAEQIAFRIESVYMTASSDYEDARTYAIQAAQDLYGEGSQEEISVTDAMYAIGVGDAYDGNGGGSTSSSYCESEGSDYSYEWISKVAIGEYSNSSSASGYTDFTSEVIDVNADETYTISLTPAYASSAYNEYWKIWIDFDNDTTFSSDELVFDAGALSNTTVSGTITIPANISGVRRMRVSMKYNGEQDACETFSYGEVEDYTIDISASSSADTEAPTAPSNLAASTLTSSSITLSWTASTDNVAVSKYNIYQNGTLVGTSTTNSYTASGLSASTSYSYYVTAVDAANNTSDASSTISATTAAEEALTYCTSKGNNVTYEWIDLVQINEINNTTTSNGGYSDYTNLTANVGLGSSQTIYFSSGFQSSSYTEYWHVWIDWDHSGTFDSDEEMVSGSSSSDATLSGTFTVPSNAVLGSTRMRVTMKYNSSATACETFSYGEVEDYTINVETSSYKFYSGGNETAEQLSNAGSVDFKVYPNPAKDKVFIQFSSERRAQVSVYNISGALVMVEDVFGSGESLDISSLPKGMYTIVIDDTQKQTTTKVMKK